MSTPDYVNQQGLIDALGAMGIPLSYSGLRRLLNEGCPRLQVGKRCVFSVPEVLEWMKGRTA